MFKKLILILIGWAIFGLSTGQTQDLGQALTLRENNVDQDAKISLNTQLDILEETYHATFMYESYLVEGKQVVQKEGENDNLSAVLHKVLSPFQLTYDQIGNRSFIILPAESGQQGLD